MIIQLEIPSEFESNYDNDRFIDFFLGEFLKILIVVDCVVIMKLKQPK